MSDSERLAQTVTAFAKARLTCVGDLMLDRFVYGSVDRVSPEAPIPVLAVERDASMLGGAGNVARNVAAMGGTIALIAPVGDDEAGQDIQRLAAAERRLETSLIVVSGRSTTLKTRYVAGGQQLLRSDRETTTALDTDATQRLIAAAEDEIADTQVVLLSDYAKGALSPLAVKRIIAAARAAGKPVVVDPKTLDFRRYDGATAITPNARELAAATGMKTVEDADVVKAARAVLDATAIEAVIVTRSERGMTLVTRTGEPLHIPAEKHEVFDVSGAGDTALAALGLGLAAGLNLDDAVRVANAAAGVAVTKSGTAAVTARELTAALQTAHLRGTEEKILDAQALLDRVAQWRAQGLKVGFTNGCFDLIHPGHVSLLAQARGACDRLIVGLNTDASVRRLKGEGRPVNAELSRGVVLASLASVDAVVFFGEDTPMALIEAIRPDVLVKGADYTVATVVGAAFVQSYGGRVMLAEITPGQSTTATIQRMNR